MLARRELLVQRIVLNGDRPADAYRFAYGRYDVSDAEAMSRASKLIAIPEISKAIQRKRAIIEYKSEATGEMVVEQLWKMATADPRELSPLRIGSCRHCWGVDHHYQWTIGEYRTALAELAEQQRIEPTGYYPMPDISGGLGYNMTHEPNGDCPECHGVGVTYSKPIDTRDLSEDAALIFRGVKMKPDGSIEILVADQLKARELVGRARGVFIDRVRHEGSIAHLHAVTRAVDPHEASQAYQELVKGAPPTLGLPAPDSEDKA